PGARDHRRARTQPRRRVPRAYRPARRAPREHPRSRARGRMTTTTVTPIGLTPDLDLRGVRRLTTAANDTVAAMARHPIAYRRVPQLLIFSTIQPVVFVLLFRYVFGGAINTPGVPYVDFLMPGIFAQTVAFGAINTSIGLATDMQTGLIERFRSL